MSNFTFNSVTVKPLGNRNPLLPLSPLHFVSIALHPKIVHIRLAPGVDALEHILVLRDDGWILAARHQLVSAYADNQHIAR